MIEGHCLCGDISYQLHSELLFLYNCHCQECRAFSGASYATNASIVGNDLHISDPKARLTEYRMKNGVRYFCSRCGSSIYSCPLGSEDHPSLHVGTITHPPDHALDANIWVSEKCPWVEIPLSIKNFETGFA